MIRLLGDQILIARQIANLQARALTRMQIPG